jgi:hypothetical protein
MSRSFVLIPAVAAAIATAASFLAVYAVWSSVAGG